MFNIDPGLARHAREFLRALVNHKYERSENGVYFPDSRVVAHGLYEHRIVRGGYAMPWVCDANLLPTEGLTYLMSLLGAGTKLTPWYIALYAGAISPAAGWVASGFTATASEITSGSEGYSEANRVTWTAGTASAGAISNTASPAEFTIVTATQLTVNGIGMLTAQAKGATTGTLLSATRFASARLLNNTDLFHVKYTLGLTSS